MNVEMVISMVECVSRNIAGGAGSHREVGNSKFAKQLNFGSDTVSGQLKWFRLTPTPSKTFVRLRPRLWLKKSGCALAPTPSSCRRINFPRLQRRLRIPENIPGTAPTSRGLSMQPRFGLRLRIQVEEHWHFRITD